MRIWLDRVSEWMSCGLALAMLMALSCPAPAQSSVPLSQCDCSDLTRLKDRLDKLQGIQKLIARKLQSVLPNAPATQADWNAP